MIGTLRRATTVALASLFLLFSGVPATALNVQPVIVDLLSAGRRSSTVVTMQNSFTTTVPVELIARPVEMVDGELQELTDVEASDLLIFPAQATIEPGQSQAFRVQWVGDPEIDRSRHFYVSIAQIPVQLPENENAVQVLYTFKVLVNVGAPDAVPSLHLKSADIQTDTDGKSHPVISVENTGKTYGYVGRGRMTIIQRDAAGLEVFRQSFEPDDIQRLMGLGLVPSGTTRRLPINLDLPRADGVLTVEIAEVEGR